ncbi:hypothetical protein [Paludibaculum fermentans]|uniref:Uncharacterized protein n=1 Tax=Paludibaculum fermentans TaxID=1473598 RepID=A0A7S7NKM9_PALFE|nr:hypothetical protein [Paludibaculum fermentans]QOY85382.1 hypothetical protein IRI77_21415 [Paludibaculum fermentans]
MVLAIMLSILASRLLPRMLLAATSPLRRILRKDAATDETSPSGESKAIGPGHHDEIPHSRLVPWLKLYAVYISAAMSMVLTGGSLGKLIPVHQHEPVEAIEIALCGGLLLVSIARIQAVNQNTALALSLQTVIASGIGLATFITIVKPEIIREAAVNIKAVAPNFHLAIYIGSLFCMITVEAVLYIMHWLSDTEGRKVPYQLIRQRIEQWERAEQVWIPTQVTEATIKKIDYIRNKHTLSHVDWLTATYPIEVLLAMLGGGRETNPQFFRRVGELRRCLRILIPEAAARRFSAELAEYGLEKLRENVRLLSAGGTPRVRILVVNAAFAVLHFPIDHTPDDPAESSNFAAFLSDPLRIGEVMAAFESLWHRAKPLQPSTTAPNGSSRQRVRLRKADSRLYSRMMPLGAVSGYGRRNLRP